VSRFQGPVSLSTQSSFRVTDVYRNSHDYYSYFFFVYLYFVSQIDVLQAEVMALKTLVLTSTPSSPNRQLHPQLQSSGTRGSLKHVGHIRNKSASGAFAAASTKPELSSVSIQPVAKEDREVTRKKFTHLSLFSLSVRL